MADEMWANENITPLPSPPEIRREAFFNPGRTVSAGRGFMFPSNDGSGGFQSEDSNNDYGDERYNNKENFSDFNARGGRRGRGGYGGKGGRGGGGGGGDFGGNRGGRGSRGGGGDGDNWGGKDDNATTEKPKVVYVPPEPTNDENTLCGSGIRTGQNFDNFYNIRVKVSGSDVPDAIDTFDKSGLRASVLDNVKKSMYTKPTPIQKRAIPIMLAGRDMIGCAQTGSGKTAAFLLPIISKLLEQQLSVVVEGHCAQPQVIVVSPTRELSIQIFTEARKFAHGSFIKTCIAYGGVAPHYQSSNILIRSVCHILVATVGRLLDFVERNTVSFNSVQYVILDEADRMLHMGFRESIELIMNHPTMVAMENRQTVMFSATFPKEIQELASKFLKNYIFVTVGNVGGACFDVEQVFLKVPRLKKKDSLKEFLQEHESEQTLIFVETKRSADFIAAYIAENLTYATTSIHGDRLQCQREIALDDFKSSRCNILVATAVAARGLDIKNVSHVENYDLPTSVDEYVHRIGRTGRVGNCGRATSFFDPEKDLSLAGDLVKILTQAEQPVPEFLKLYSGSSTFTQGEFGGRDIRDVESIQSHDIIGPDESWE